MRLGMFTSGYQRNPLEDMFEDAARFGYDYVELWGGRPHGFAPDLLGGGARELRGLAERHGTTIEVYTPEHNAYPYNFMLGSDAQRQDAIAYLRTCLDVGKALGARFTTVSAGHAGYATSAREKRERLTTALTALARHAEEIDHHVVLEQLTPYESNVCTTADHLVEALEAVPSERLGVMCDIIPPYVQHEPILSYVDKLGDRLWHLHVVDGDGCADTHLVPGEGNLPLRELMAELAGSAYAGTATIELVTNYLNEPRLYARRAVTRLRGLMS